VFSHSFLDLAFDPAFSEFGKVLEVVKETVVVDPLSFCFLTNYLLKCCRRKENEGSSIREIEDALREKLNSVSQGMELNALVKVQGVSDEAVEKFPNRRVVMPVEKKTYLIFNNDSDKE
jgi:hypothetical protein